MVWLLPTALAGLAAVLGPLVVHLLHRQRARTVVVPTVRFIPAVDQSVVRLRRPADLLLLLVRMSIVACAAVALAGPLFLTASRAERWADRVARVAVVDTSNPTIAAIANEAAAAELRSAAFSRRIDSAQLEPALRQASAWLNSAPPARRELVVISDFRVGAFDESRLRDLPASIGLRLVAARTKPEAAREIAIGESMGPEVLFERRARIDAAATSATFRSHRSSPDGLRLLVSPEDGPAAARLLRVVARAGAHAPSGAQAITVRFTGGPALNSHANQAAEGWSRDAALRLLRHADAADLPVQAGVGHNGELLVDVDARPETLIAAQALQAVLNARQDPGHLPAQEIAHLPADRLDELRRPSPPADTPAWQRSDDSDARWFWLAGLGLLALESWLRRGKGARVADGEVDAHAA